MARGYEAEFPLIGVSEFARPPLTSAVDGSNCLAMLVRRDGESLNALLKRLDKAIAWLGQMDTFIDEVNGGESDLL